MRFHYVRCPRDGRAAIMQPDNGNDNRVAANDSPFNCRAVGACGAAYYYASIPAIEFGFSLLYAVSVSDQNSGLNSSDLVSAILAITSSGFSDKWYAKANEAIVGDRDIPAEHAIIVRVFDRKRSVAVRKV
ncbi:MAG: hypothetical protein Aurels2KO_53180 [Aureliella sp.]